MKIWFYVLIFYILSLIGIGLYYVRPHLKRMKRIAKRELWRYIVDDADKHETKKK